MSYRLSIITTGALIFGAMGAAAGELPGYQVSGFPITPLQLVVLEPANVGRT